jgi:hypothetical protein
MTLLSLFCKILLSILAIHKNQAFQDFLFLKKKSTCAGEYRMEEAEIWFFSSCPTRYVFCV